MYLCSLNKNFDDLDEKFKCTNKVLEIIAVNKTRITKQTSLTINISLKNYTIQTLSAEFLSESDCFYWDHLVKGYELSGNELISCCNFFNALLPHVCKLISEK